MIRKRGVTAVIWRELRRRPAIESVIGHVKAQHRRNYLLGDGDAVNPILAAQARKAPDTNVQIAWSAFFADDDDPQKPAEAVSVSDAVGINLRAVARP